MIYIIGDTHGDMSRLYNYQQKNKFTKNDYIIVCGDFGFIWNGDYKKIMKKIGRVIPATVLFVDGNHENFDIILSKETETKWGGTVTKFWDNVYYLNRGEVYTIEGHTFFCFGGAHSIDQAWRVPHKSWWEEEIPTLEEIMKGAENLENNLNKIEYVITHEAPAIIRKKILTHHSTEFGEPLSYRLPSIFNQWFERLYFDAPNFKKWFCGHHHQDIDFDEEGLPFSVLYRTIGIIT